MVHPNAAKALEMLDDESGEQALRLGPDRLTTTLTWAQEFSGEVVSAAVDRGVPQPATDATTKLASRVVKTLPP
ncbi:MAG: hypothetical protein WC807_19990 [Hyphomicrobium sp.]|jgi:hypothetical protein